VTVIVIDVQDGAAAHGCEAVEGICCDAWQSITVLIRQAASDWQ
jgi:hypothetical protein